MKKKQFKIDLSSYNVDYHDKVEWERDTKNHNKYIAVSGLPKTWDVKGENPNKFPMDENGYVYCIVKQELVTEIK